MRKSIYCNFVDWQGLVQLSPQKPSGIYKTTTLNRFLSADTIVPDSTNPQTLNRYSYGYNNPVKYTDPSGHLPCDFCGGGGAGALIFGSDNQSGQATRNAAFTSLLVTAYITAGNKQGLFDQVRDSLVQMANDAQEAASHNLNLLKQELTNNIADNSLEDLAEDSQPNGLERDLDNNETGHPLSTPRNLPDPGASDQEIQDALGPDWSPPFSPNRNWHNKNTGESLRPDVNNPDHPGDPHWDYNYRGSRNSNPYGSRHGWRLKPDGTNEPKK